MAPTSWPCQLAAVHSLLSNQNIKFVKNMNSSFLCHGCSISKIHKLPFAISSHRVTVVMFGPMCNIPVPVN
ncbi:hypothetical protein LINGRAHAP2_LOCUS9885 [Linum grandiflorum]